MRVGLAADGDVARVSVADAGRGIAEMKERLALCLEGELAIPERKAVLDAKRAELVARIAKLEGSVGYIDWKRGCYDSVLSGELTYMSNLIAAG